MLAREQIEAESKEHVLNALGSAASKLRAKLGESIGSVEKFDTPLAQATTTSLEALKAYSAGGKLLSSGRPFEAVPLYKRAIELDQNFASAYSGLSADYFNTGQLELASEAAEKAFALRDRASERERLGIENQYYRRVTGDMENAIRVGELYRRTYPGGFALLSNLAVSYFDTGQFEKSAETARDAISLGSKGFQPYGIEGFAFIRLDRFEEAKDVLKQALAQQLDAAIIHLALYYIAFVESDSAVVQLAAADAVSHAVFGRCREAYEEAAGALALSRDQVTLIGVGSAHAVCGAAGQAQPIIDEMDKRFPKATVVNGIWLPVIRAALANSRGKAADAIELLKATTPYERAGRFWPAYVRGRAYLSLKMGAAAVAEFQRILDHRGEDTLSPLYPLAHLGLARAAALSGDMVKSRKAYQDFLALWKDADPDLPVPQEAKQEYARLQ